ncbi:DUF2783 domain-containing protein [Halomonas sp. SpR1]|nr:DUF2783 domain-containing protein [Halomonas sp. SpR1]MDQ7735244.1 DUF2783 domain-containing protein [Halomonas sp. SpR1]
MPSILLLANHIGDQAVLEEAVFHAVSDCDK